MRMRWAFLWILPTVNCGCALSYGAGLGMTVDSEGTTGVLLTVSGSPLGFRAKSENPHKHGGVTFTPMQVAGGYEFNPDAWTMQVRGPGVGGFIDHSDNDLVGFAFDAHLTSVFRWPREGESTGGIGPGIGFAWLPHRSKSMKKTDACHTQDDWTFHSFGPSIDASLLWRSPSDKNEVWGYFFTGVEYRRTQYHTITMQECNRDLEPPLP